jgi:hypothetical protein
MKLFKATTQGREQTLFYSSSQGWEQNYAKNYRPQNEGLTLRDSASGVLRPILELSAHRRQFARADFNQKLQFAQRHRDGPASSADRREQAPH